MWYFIVLINLGNRIIVNSGAGSQDVFIVKLKSNSEPLWAKSGGSSGSLDYYRKRV